MEMTQSTLSLTEAGQGPQAITPVEPHWFSPTLTKGGASPLVIAPYTTDDNDGTAPYDVTLTTTDVGAGTATGPTIPIASYQTGYNFHIASTTEANGDHVVLYDVANGTYPQSSAVDIDAELVDSQGHPIGAPGTLQSDVQNLAQFRVDSAATGSSGYVLTYATVDETTHTETVHLQGYTSDGSPVAGQSGVLDSFSLTNGTTGTSFGFDALQPSDQPDPSFVYMRGSTDNGQYPNNVGVKYETVSNSGQPTSAITLIEPPYPTGSSSPDLLNFAFEPLTPTAASGNDLAIIMRYSYVDASGATQEALDVHTLNTATNVGSDHVVRLAGSDTDSNLTETVLANGDIAVGYDDGSSQPLKVQIFDTNGNALGAPLALPNDETGFTLSTDSAGQLLVEWTADTPGGQQLEDDVYNVNASGTSSPSTGGQAVGLQPFGDIFNHKKADVSFVFSQGDGLDVIHGFKVGGAGHDTLELPSADFTNLAAVLHNTGDIQGSAFITDPLTGDAIRLAGVTTAQLKAHPKDIAFV